MSVGTVAVDDMQLEEGACRSFGACDFERHDMCSWHNVHDEARDILDWSFGSHRTPTPRTGPAYDHTLGNAFGVYLYLEASPPAQTGQNAILESSLFFPTPTTGLCMHFWYHMYGREMGTLNVHLNVSNKLTLVWSRSGDKGFRWLSGQVHLLSSRSFHISIEAVRGWDARSDMAIDDIDFIERECVSDPFETSDDPTSTSVSTTTPTATTVRPRGEYDCDFEEDFCIWTQDETNRVHWYRAQGQLGTHTPGPIRLDHTLGKPNGWYVFAAFSKAVKANHYGRLTTSKKLTGGGGGGHCMTFYYYVVTSASFKLRVYARNGNATDATLWSRSSSQGNFWKMGRVSVRSAKFSDEFSVEWELKRLGAGFELFDDTQRQMFEPIEQRAASNAKCLFEDFSNTDNVFALDDVTFVRGECTDGSDIDQLCTFSNNHTCDFSITPAASSEDTAAFAWKLFTPSSSSSSSSRVVTPSPILINDHTTDDSGSGFVYADASGFSPGATTTMTSREYEAASSQRCLEFYYFLRGNEANALTLNVFRDEYSVLWSRDFDHKSHWWKADVPLKYLNEKYSIKFQAVVNEQNSTSKAALDDIIFKSGECKRYEI